MRFRLSPLDANTFQWRILVGIGEAAGALAAWSMDNNTTPRSVRNQEEELRDFQRMLETSLHIPLKWPSYEIDTTLRRGHGHSTDS